MRYVSLAAVSLAVALTLLFWGIAWRLSARFLGRFDAVNRNFAGGVPGGVIGIYGTRGMALG